jgi:transposase
MFGVSQSTVSRAVSDLTELVEKALASFIPDAEEAAEAIKGRVCLLDGSLGPCWSWAGERELWAGKHKTTGHNFQVISDLDGNVLAVSEPVPGNRHDTVALEETGFDLLLKLAGDVIADKGYQGTGYVTPVKKPKGGELLMREEEYNSWVSGLRAAVERAVANIKTWRILHTDYRRPLKTYKSSFNAAIGLYFFELSFA